MVGERFFFEKCWIKSHCDTRSPNIDLHQSKCNWAILHVINQLIFIKFNPVNVILEVLEVDEAIAKMETWIEEWADCFGDLVGLIGL